MTNRSLCGMMVAGVASLLALAGVAHADDDRDGSKYSRQDNSAQRFSEQRGGVDRFGRSVARSDQGKYGNDNARNGHRGNDAGRDDGRRQDYSSRGERRHDYRGDQGKRRDDYRGNDDRRHDYRRDENKRGDHRRHDYRRDDDKRGDYRRHDYRRDDDKRGDYRRHDYRRHDYRRDDSRHRHTYRSNYRPPDYSRYGSRYTHYDTRWHHYGSYPRRGYVTRALPRNVVVVKHRHYNYWYGGGVWYAPRGPSYVVVAPPIGVFVSVLPSYYSTVWFGGLPYYYANDAYYFWRAERRAYEVVEPPPVAQASTAGPAAEDIFVYPREGQDEEQVASDRYECHRWAVDETGFDPTRPEGGVPADQVRSARSDYMRAMTACLEGRGYSVT